MSEPLSQFPLTLDADQYLDGPLAAGHGVDAFVAGEWQGRDGNKQDGDGNPGRSSRGHGHVLASLGLIYLRHGEPARAMVLGLAAMSMGDLAPKTILMVGEAILTAGDPQQALAVLTRFDRDTGLSTAPSQTELAARHYIAARIYHRLGDTGRARDELGQASRIAAAASGDGE